MLDIYYRHISPVDLENSSSTDLIGAAIAHWQLLRERTDSDPKIRVYNPSFEEHGWQSRHTIIEIVTDDMSFLVDSTSMGLNRAGITIHLTIHPVAGVVRDKLGRLLAVHDISTGLGKPESMICFQIEKQLARLHAKARANGSLGTARCHFGQPGLAGHEAAGAKYRRGDGRIDTSRCKGGSVRGKSLS